MASVRFNITLPEAIGNQLKKVGNKSAFIAKAIEEMFEKKQAIRRRTELAEAYRLESQEERHLTHDWDNTLGDGL